MTRPTTDASALLVHADFVRHLARGLLSDPNRVDDVVQETWVAAVQSPPRDDSSPRAWLATVLRNRVREEHRRTSSRARRERAVAAAEGAPSTAQIAAQESVRRHVVDAVLTLDEPYRSVVLLRYYEDRPPREIARRLSVPVETVRTRLKRGLELLRGRLDAEHGGDRSSWAAVLAPVALAEPARAGILGLAAALLTLPGLVGLGAGAVALAIFLPSWFGGGEAPSAPEAVAVAPLPVEEPAAVATRGEEEAQAGASEAAVRSVATSPPPRFSGVVVDAADGDPVPGAAVQLLGLVGTPAALRGADVRDHLVVREVRTGADGRFGFTDLVNGSYAVVARASDARRVSRTRLMLLGDAWSRMAAQVRAAWRGSGPSPHAYAADGESTEATLALEPAGRIEGRVTDSAGRPIADAVVVAYDEGSFDRVVPLEERRGPFVHWTASDAAGTFTLDGLLGPLVLAARADGRYAARAEVALAPGDTLEQTLVLRERARWSVRGHVRATDGRPVPGAAVYFGHVSQTRVASERARDPARFEESDMPRVTADENGAFTFVDLAGGARTPWLDAPKPGDTFCLLAAADGHLAGWSAAYAPADLPPRVDVTLVPSDVVPGRVVDSATGRPVAGASIVLSRGFDILHTTKSAEDGGFSLSNVPADGAMIAVRAPGYSPQQRRPLPTARPLRLELDGGGWTIRGEVVDPGGRPVPRSRTVRLGDASLGFETFEAWAVPSDPTELLEHGQELGSARLGIIRRGVRISVAPDGATFSVTTDADWGRDEAWLVMLVGERVAEVRRVTPTDGTVRFVIDPSDAVARFGFVAVRAVDDRGSPIEGASIAVHRAGESETRGSTMAEVRGVAWARVDEAGTFDLRVTAPGYGATVVPAVPIPEGGRVGPLVAILGDAGRIEGRVVADGAQVDQAWCALFDADGRRVTAITAQDGLFTFEGLGAGRHLVRAGRHDRGFAEVSVDVGADQTSRVDLTLGTTHRVELDLSGWPGDATAPASIVIQDADGRTLGTGPLDTRFVPGHRPGWWIASGDWRVRIVSPGVAAVEQTFSIERAGTTVVAVAFDR